ncbi:PPE family protein [Mycobacterium heckeshornense]|uniref:PPE family protein n=1 Tax=Mycobacterium heckeshornense TaxID=110505 RepID=UPI0006626298|nr:PPE family protein [Mycobacterium heckeshornense]KMV21473.1 hypothetical protein ACT16_16425 [Mycobacterium heckeshornense]MCV7034157.1 PPE family protein [Mycobacterium heckeshornense]
MDFGALPPEINSARIYAGPGSGPLMAAAAAWNSLAAELASAASSYQSVISSLTSEAWTGPSAAAMATAAAPYVAWLHTTAAAAEHAAGQAAASAAAYQTAFAMTVPPPVIAANRAQLAALVATNFLGQNTPAIMATEAHYAEMWAQDAAAMYGYASSSASAGILQPLAPPAPNTNPGGLAGQVAATATAGTQTELSQLVAGLPNAVQGLASPLAGSASASGGASGFLSDFINSTQNIGIWNATQTYTAAVGNIGAWNMFAGIARGISSAGAGPGVPSGTAAAVGPGGLTSSAGGSMLAGQTGPARSGGAPVSAGVGQAATVGRLSVPTTWSAATSAGDTEAAFPGSGWTSAAEETSPVAAMPAAMPSVASASRGAAGFGAPRYGFKPTVVTRPVVAG